MVIAMALSYPLNESPGSFLPGLSSLPETRA